jgi:hypothetical protein
MASRSVVSTDKSSGKCATTTDDLSPGARRLYDLIVAGCAAPTSAASPRVHEPATTTATGPPPWRSCAPCPQHHLHQQPLASVLWCVVVMQQI